MLNRLSRAISLLVALAGFAGCGLVSAAPNGPVPPPTTDVPLTSAPTSEGAVFAGGCFWGTQAVFERVKGVTKTTVGYAGGSAATASYDQVTTETTGHAESVHVTFDASKITYGQLLRIFFPSPTTRRRKTGRGQTSGLRIVR